MANSYTRTLVEKTAGMSLIPKPAGVLAKHSQSWTACLGKLAMCLHLFLRGARFESRKLSETIFRTQVGDSSQLVPKFDVLLTRFLPQIRRKVLDELAQDQIKGKRVLG